MVADAAATVEQAQSLGAAVYLPVTDIVKSEGEARSGASLSWLTPRARDSASCRISRRRRKAAIGPELLLSLAGPVPSWPSPSRLGNCT